MYFEAIQIRANNKYCSYSVYLAFLLIFSGYKKTSHAYNYFEFTRKKTAAINNIYINMPLIELLANIILYNKKSKL